MTSEHNNLKAAEAAFAQADTIENLDALEDAEAAYLAAIVAVKARWAGLNVSDEVRDNAEINANETEGAADDELYWHQMAIGTAELEA